MKPIYFRILILLFPLVFTHPAIFCAITSDTIKPIPFTETWESASFSTNNWTFPWSQGNWTILNNLGNPSPCAGFPGMPSQSNYINALQSPWFDATDLTCDDIHLSFDLKLETIDTLGTEKFRIEMDYDSITKTLDLLKNSVGIEWHDFKYKLNVMGKLFRIRFMASGTNSSRIFNWMIDNIAITRECLRPLWLSGFPIMGECWNPSYPCKVKLTWTPPQCQPTGQIMNFIFDDGTAEKGWGISPGITSWLGNEFPVSSFYQGVIQSFDIYFYGSMANFEMTVDVFDGSRTWVGSSFPFTPPTIGWLNVQVNDIPFNGLFYAMVKWNSLPAAANWMGYDENGPASAADLEWYFDGVIWDKLVNVAGANPGVFLIRATAWVEGKKKSIPGFYNNGNADSSLMLGYNIYKEDVYQTTFSKINTSPVIESFYIDTVLTPTCEAWYYVTAVYSNQCESKASDTIIFEGCFSGIPGSNLQDQILISPNPAKDFAEITSDSFIENVTLVDPAGSLIRKISFKKEKTIRIDLSEIADGMYFVVVGTEKGQVVQKIMITH